MGRVENDPSQRGSLQANQVADALLIACHQNGQCHLRDGTEVRIRLVEPDDVRLILILEKRRFDLYRNIHEHVVSGQKIIPNEDRAACSAPSEINE